MKLRSFVYAQCDARMNFPACICVVVEDFTHYKYNVQCAMYVQNERITKRSVNEVRVVKIASTALMKSVSACDINVQTTTK